MFYILYGDTQEEKPDTFHKNTKVTMRLVWRNRKEVCVLSFCVIIVISLVWWELSVCERVSQSGLCCHIHNNYTDIYQTLSGQTIDRFTNNSMCAGTSYRWGLHIKIIPYLHSLSSQCQWSRSTHLNWLLL